MVRYGVSFLGVAAHGEEPQMPTIEDLIRILIPILPGAEVIPDESGQVVIYTGLTMPVQTA